MTNTTDNDDAKMHDGLLQRLEHGDRYFELKGFEEDEDEAYRLGADDRLIRRRGRAMTTAFTDLYRQNVRPRMTDDVFRSEIAAQVLHELAIVRDAATAYGMPAVDRIAARDLDRITSQGDEHALGRLAARIERLPLDMVEAPYAAVGDSTLCLRWRRVDGPVERWILGRETPHLAGLDGVWMGRAIEQGKAELWVLEDVMTTQMSPHMQVLVDTAHPGIAAILRRRAEVPEFSTQPLRDHLIRRRDLMP